MKLNCLLRINIQACKLLIKDGGRGKGREKRERRREEKVPLHICHSLAVLLFWFCLILKMVHLTGIKQQFQPKWVEIMRIWLTRQLP